MHDHRTNLMPQERQRAFVREYLMRLGVVAAALAVALTIAAALLLFPSYVYLSSSAAAKQAHLATIQSALSAANEAALSQQLTALNTDAKTLLALQNAPMATNIITDLLGVSRPGVTLSGINYTPASSGEPGMLIVSGMALTRDALRNYQLALQGASFASSADLPVSAYAKNSDIPFTISITLAP